MPTANIAVPLEHRVAALQAAYPGIGLTKHGPEWRVIVPDALRLPYPAEDLFWALYRSDPNRANARKR